MRATHTAAPRSLTPPGQAQAPQGMNDPSPPPLAAQAGPLIRPRLAQLHDAAPPGHAVVLQRIVHELKRGPREHRGKFYSTHDEDRYFNTREEAEAHQTGLIEAREAEKERKRAEQQAARQAEHAEELKKFPPRDISKVSGARLFKSKDREYDDVDLVNTTPRTIKKTFERTLTERRAGTFNTTVFKVGDGYHVLDPGTDVKGTRALQRPSLGDRSDDRAPFSREGQAKTYPEVITSGGLSTIDQEQSAASGLSHKKTRVRIGKDVDRLTRGNPPSRRLRYSASQRKGLEDLAFIVRLDKGRVPKATKEIRKQLTSGQSLHRLFHEEKYPGAGTGGVDRLRHLETDDGAESEGSDIEPLTTPDAPTRPGSRKRKPVAPVSLPGRKIARTGETEATSAPVSAAEKRKRAFAIIKARHAAEAKSRAQRRARLVARFRSRTAAKSTSTSDE